RRGPRRPATATPDPRQRPAGLRLLPALAALGHDGAHLERQQGRRDHLLRRPRAARPLRSSRTHLADKDGFGVKRFSRRHRRGLTSASSIETSRRWRRFCSPQILLGIPKRDDEYLLVLTRDKHDRILKPLVLAQ